MKTATFRILFLSVFLLLIFPPGKISQVYALTASESAVPAAPSTTEFDRLANRVDQLGNDQYQHAINVAEEAGQKADSILNWMASFATIFGFIILVITFTVGKNLYDSLKELRAHARAAKKSSQAIDNLAIEAQAKGEQLAMEVSEIQTLKKTLAGSNSKTQEKEQQLDKLLEQAQGTISDIQALKNSATMVSGATLSYPPVGTFTVADGFGAVTGPRGPMRKCIKCGNELPLSYQGSIGYGYAGISNADICLYCSVGGNKGS